MQIPDDAAGTALGILDLASWSPVDVPLGQGGRPFLFTDGLIEGFDSAAGERLGDKRLFELLEQLLAADADAESLPDRLLHEVQRRNGGELTDDVAILLLAWSAAG